MTEQEFIFKYGKEPVWFKNIYKFRVTYVNESLGIECSGIVESRDDLSCEETVWDIFNLDYFKFSVKE